MSLSFLVAPLSLLQPHGFFELCRWDFVDPAIFSKLALRDGVHEWVEQITNEILVFLFRNLVNYEKAILFQTSWYEDLSYHELDSLYCQLPSIIKYSDFYRLYTCYQPLLFFQLVKRGCVAINKPFVNKAPSPYPCNKFCWIGGSVTKVYWE